MSKISITADNLEDFARGAAFLGTGGGGDPYIGRMLAHAAIKEFGVPEVITADELDDDDLVLTAAMLGSPPVLLEKACCGEDMDLAIHKLEEHLGRKAKAILPIEIGGVNSTLPIMAAARLGLPVIDADGMGRAFPELQMVTFNVYGCSATPLVVTDEHMNSVLIEADSGPRAEGLVRATAIQMGLSVMISSFPLIGRQVKDFAVHARSPSPLVSVKPSAKAGLRVIRWRLSSPTSKRHHTIITPRRSLTARWLISSAKRRGGSPSGTVTLKGWTMPAAAWR